MSPDCHDFSNIMENCVTTTSALSTLGLISLGFTEFYIFRFLIWSQTSYDWRNCGPQVPLGVQGLERCFASPKCNTSFLFRLRPIKDLLIVTASSILVLYFVYEGSTWRHCRIHPITFKSRLDPLGIYAFFFLLVLVCRMATNTYKINTPAPNLCSWNFVRWNCSGKWEHPRWFGSMCGLELSRNRAQIRQDTCTDVLVHSACPAFG